LLYEYIMNINELVKKLEYIVIEKLEFQAFYLGNPFDMSVTKGDKYPNSWLELPIITNYSLQNKNTKEINFSMDFLFLSKVG
jgi:hypothetical protein